MPEKPEFPQGTNTVFSVSEDASSGTNVDGSVAVAEDPIDGQPAYSIVGTTNVQIDASTGQISVASAASLDFESAPVQQVTVVATNAAGFASLPITISLEDANDAPVAPAATQATIPECAAAQTVVATLAFTDQDAIDRADVTASSYALVCDGQQGLFVLGFAGDAPSMAVQVQHVGGSTGAALDFETMRSGITCEVTMTDAGGPAIAGQDRSASKLSSTPATVSISITDCPEPPQLAVGSYEGTLVENAAGIVPVGSVSATDEDDNDSITYSLEGTALFGVHGATGAISYLGTGENYEAYPEGSAELQFVVVATDSTGLRAESQYTIIVEDVNEAPSIAGPPTAADAPRVISKSSSSGAPVSGPALEAVDEDRYSSHSFATVGCSGMGCEAFGFATPSDGTLQLVDASLLREDVGVYEVSIMVQVTDDGTPSGAVLSSPVGVVRIVVSCPDAACPAGEVAFGVCARSVSQQCFALAGPASTGGGAEVIARRTGGAEDGSGSGAADIDAQTLDTVPPVDGASRDGDGAVVMSFGADDIDGVSADGSPVVGFFRVTSVGECGDIEECPEVSVFGMAEGDEVDLGLVSLAGGSTGNVRIESIQSDCVSPGADLTALSDESCYDL